MQMRRCLGTRVSMMLTSMALLSACATSYPPLSQVDQAAQAMRAFEPAFAVVHASAPIILVGDNQENYNLGLPHYAVNSGVDLLAPVAVRPPQHSLFGRQTLAYAIQETGNDPIVHLGDFLDHSCDTELGGIFELFNQAQQSGKPWAGIMGNHDGLFNGLLNQPSIERRSALSSYGWRLRCRKVNMPSTPADTLNFALQDRVLHRNATDACLEAVLFLAHRRFSVPGHPRSASAQKTLIDCAETFSAVLGAPLDNIHDAPRNPKLVSYASSNISKDQIVERYLASLQRGDRFTNKHNSQPTMGGLEPLALEAVNPTDFVQRVEGGVVSREPLCNNDFCPGFTRSYLLQSLLLPQQLGTKQFRLLLLDTTHTEKEFARWDVLLRRSPGDVGFVGERQAEQFGVEVTKHKDAILILGGHHPWSSLDKSSHERVANAICKINHPLIYLSAHTHNGFWSEHTIACGDKGMRRMLELNISSLADWPIAFKRISFEANADASLIRVNAPNQPTRTATSTSTYSKSLNGSSELLQAWRDRVCTAVPEEVRSLSESEQYALSELDSKAVLRDTVFYTFLAKQAQTTHLYRSDIDIRVSSLRILSAGYKDPLFATEFSALDMSAMSADCASRSSISEALTCQSKYLTDAENSRDVKHIRRTFDQATLVLDDFRRMLRTKEHSAALTKHSRNLMACLHVEAAYRDAMRKEPKEHSPINSCQFIEQVVASTVNGLGKDLNNLCQNKREELR